VHFAVDGSIQEANAHFQNLMGYHIDKILGKHHRMFIRKDFHSNPEYLQFWSKLSRGEAQSVEYRHINKAGTYIWIQSTYLPIKNSSGEVLKVVEYCTDITQLRESMHEFHMTTYPGFDPEGRKIEMSLLGPVQFKQEL